MLVRKEVLRQVFKLDAWWTLRASTALVNYLPTTTATIPSGYFISTVLTNCSVSTIPSYCARSVPLLDLLDLLCRLTVPTVPFYYFDCSTTTVLPTATNRLLPTDCYRPFATTKISATGCPTAY